MINLIDDYVLFQNDRQKRAAMQVRHVDLTSATGEIYSPGFHEGILYPINLEITWTLHLPVDAAYDVVLNVSSLEIEYEQNCNWDYFAFDKDFTRKLCGMKSQVYVVENVVNSTMFKFHSDFYVSRKGFLASYRIRKVANKCDSSPCVNNGKCVRLSSEAYRCDCSQHYTGKHCQDFKAASCTSYPCLVFEDNFDFLNHRIWEHEITLGGGGNWEFQHYTNNRSNSYTRDGVLYIKPTLTIDNYGDDFLQSGTLDVWGHTPHNKCTGNAFYGCARSGSPGNLINPIQSARLRSSRGLNIKYGKVEIEAKLPVGDWLWPAIWMMPTYAAYGGWPASGEIDIMESRGNLNYTDVDGLSMGVDHSGSTLHYGPNWKINGYLKATAAKRLSNGQTFADAFHRYAVEWTEDHLRFTLDDEEVLKVAPDDGGFWKYGEFDESMESPWRYATKMAPFDQEFYIILNVAVGGMSYFPDNFISPYPKPWSAASQTQFWANKDKWYPTWNPDERDGEDAAMKINHVKVWKLNPIQ
ncbi:hypothetical protein SNE40_003879 [Patella caerulea]|uniref:Uncharacterized protein n=1 Tax=Patella caerulea TaxID=87958 RepID=A0AAN8Q1B2_PATCE